MVMNTAAISTLPESTNELYAQLLFVALERLGLDAQAFLAAPERARAASDAFCTLWLTVELAASCAEPSQLDDARFDRTRHLPSLPKLRTLARGLDEGAIQQLSSLNGSGLLVVSPECWLRCMPPRGTDVMSTLGLAWLAEAAVLGDELVVWLSDSRVLRRVVDMLAILIEQGPLQAAAANDAGHLPLSRSVVSEEERLALLDVWQAERAPAPAPALASLIVARSSQPANTTTAPAPADQPLDVPASVSTSVPASVRPASHGVASQQPVAERDSAKPRPVSPRPAPPEVSDGPGWIFAALAILVCMALSLWLWFGR
jgi:hypothetical protein